MATNIFQDNTKSLPKQDSQIVRVTMKKDDVTSNGVPTPSMGKDMALQHVPNAGSKT